MKSRTLYITSIPLKFIVSTLVVLALLFSAAEIFFRQASVQAMFSAPTLNSRHNQLETQWHRLETLVEMGEHVPCIALGNSMVWRAFDPASFSNGYQSQSGAPITCFNFGVDGMTAVGAGIMAEILTEHYHPELIIYGTSPRDYTGTLDIENNKVLLDMKWIQHHTGKPNFEGWLVENSYLYRYRHHIADLLNLFFRDALPTPETSSLNRYGYDIDDTVATDIDAPPDPEAGDYLVDSYFRLLNHYTMEDENLAGLEKLLTLPGVQVIVVEMPVPDTFYAFFENHKEGYQVFLKTIREVTEDHKAVFIELSQEEIIPMDGWVDYAHLNTAGAAVYSDWLGRQVARVYKNPQDASTFTRSQ